MVNSGGAGVLAGVAGLSRATAFAPDWRKAFAAALAREVEERRFFLWLPVAAMGGVALNLAADREPALWLPALLAAGLAALAWVCRARPFARALSLAALALVAGFLSMSLRTARVSAPVLDRIRIVDLTGWVEEVDLRSVGARMVIVVDAADGMPSEKVPRRVRVTTRKTPDVAAGDFVALKARLLPPSRASMPGGYDFARDAYFAGSARSARRSARSARIPPPADASWSQRFHAAIDHARNRLAQRVNEVIGGDEGAIAAAMVTGKRDFLSNDARDLIREAGIFHIITISGVQMTLVAGIFFVGVRRLLALSPMLALNFPIKKWAAAIAMCGALVLRCRDRLARRHGARAVHDADRARRGHPGPARAHHAQSRLRRLRGRRHRARGDPGRELPALLRRRRGAGRGDGGAACREWSRDPDPFLPQKGRDRRRRASSSSLCTNRLRS